MHLVVEAAHAKICRAIGYTDKVLGKGESTSWFEQGCQARNDVVNRYEAARLLCAQLLRSLILQKKRKRRCSSVASDHSLSSDVLARCFQVAQCLQEPVQCDPSRTTIERAIESVGTLALLLQQLDQSSLECHAEDVGLGRAFKAIVELAAAMHRLEVCLRSFQKSSHATTQAS